MSHVASTGIETRQGVRNYRVEEDLETHAKYISFSDPDGIAWELSSVSTHPDV